MSGAKIEVIEDGVTIRPSPDQLAAWTRSAGEQPIAEWLEGVADDASSTSSYDERTWPAVIKLQQEIVFGERRVAQLEMRRGKLQDIKGVKLGGDVPVEQLITIASRLSGEPTQVIERLDPADAGEVIGIALDFYARCLGGGKKR